MIVRAAPLALAASAVLASQAHAQAALEYVVQRAGNRDQSGHILVDVRVLNAGAAAQEVRLPDEVAADLVSNGTYRKVWLQRGEKQAAVLTIRANGFAAARYRIDFQDVMDGAALSIPSWSTQQILLTIGVDPEADRSAPVALTAAPSLTPPTSPQISPDSVTPSPTDRTRGNAFIPNLSVYEPIYAVYGPGTNTDARIQISFKYQLFGSRARMDRSPSLIDGLYFAYTQRMFWDVAAKSSPFRNIDYQPELFYLSPALPVSEKATISGQIGLRHESNGRDGAASRSLNMLYVAPMAVFSLGEDRRLTIAPRLWLYLGDLSDNPDIRRYRGNSGLFIEASEDDGLRVSASTRLNLGSGKGALTADLSYPFRRILGGGPDFYLFGQGFTGYGENLLDYNKHVTRLRIGVALVR